jgi:fructokinase
VDVRGIKVHRTAKTGVTFVSVAADGARSFLFFRHPSADQLMSEHDLDATLIDGARILHVGSSTLAREPARSATLAAVARARGAGRLVSSDPNWRPHLWDDPREAEPLLRRLLGGCDLVKISDDELKPLLGTDSAEEGGAALRALGVKLAVVTLGARGAYFSTVRGAGYVPGERVHVVDTTGAGDAFWAGCLAVLLGRLRSGARLEDLAPAELEAALRQGNRLGAAAVTRLGATAGLPTAGGVR